jgi:hypothetical protein
MGRCTLHFLVAIAFFTLLFGCQEKKAPLQSQTTRPKEAVEPEEPPATAAERTEALKRLEKAIEAHGGADGLQKLAVSVQKLKGMMRMSQLGMMPAEQELKIQFPSQLRLVSKISFPMETKQLYLGLNKNGGWYGTTGETREMSEIEVTDHRGELYLRRVFSLIPLKGDEFNLKPIDSLEVDGKPTFGIRVSHKQWPSVNLYFDAESSLLVRSLCRFSQAGVVALRETNFLDFKPVHGVKLPSRIVERLGADKILDTSVSYSFPARIEDKEFEQP